ncbi:hypothetical protein [Brucella thiophenivorans]|nr:hypothetical protein [Brucella thiophenivorans]
MKTKARSKLIPLIENGGPWRSAAWPMIKWCTTGGLCLGFMAGILSLLGGNTISFNGIAIAGWYGVWTLTLALGTSGFLFGLVWALVFRAIEFAARR